MQWSATTVTVHVETAPTKSRRVWLIGASMAAALGFVLFDPVARQAGSSGLLGEVHAGEGETFITECMEAALMWKADTVDFRLAATSQERTALRARCSAAYAGGEITPEMQDVRSGARHVRDGQQGVHTTSVF